MSVRNYWELIEPLFDSIDFGSDEAALEASTALIPQASLHLLAAHLCLAEVHNGGLLQFFWNSTGILAPRAVEAFRSLGMLQLALILQTVSDRLGEPYPLDRKRRFDAMLAASGRSAAELEHIFATQENFYLCYREATDGLFPESLDSEVWQLAKTEAGGFQEAADRFAATLGASGQGGVTSNS